MRFFIVGFVVLSFLMALPRTAEGQASPELDGSSIVGRVVAVNDSSIQIQTAGGRLNILFDAIRDVQSASQRAAEGWFPNPNSTRLLFAPTGQMLKKGEGYFSDYELFFPGVAYGVTDNFSIGGAGRFRFQVLTRPAARPLRGSGSRLTNNSTAQKCHSFAL